MGRLKGKIHLVGGLRIREGYGGKGIPGQDREVGLKILLSGKYAFFKTELKATV